MCEKKLAQLTVSFYGFAQRMSVSEKTRRGNERIELVRYGRDGRLGLSAKGSLNNMLRTFFFFPIQKSSPNESLSLRLSKQSEKIHYKALAS